jgi:co-chaperonin GroES (HSP10)
MADKKVSQETDLGLAGIDGTVEYRVIKSGGTYKQKYSDLFSYIASNTTIPTLQQVLDYNHDLSPDNFWAGTVAGAGVTTNHNVGIGEYAGYNNNGGGSISIGYAAGALNNNSSNVVAIGYAALNSANLVGGAIAVGNGALKSSNGGDSIGIGNAALQYNDSQYSIGIGYTAGSQNTKAYSLMMGYHSGDTNKGDELISIGKNAGFTNQGNNVISIGSNAGNANLGNNLIAIGTDAANNSGAGFIQSGEYNIAVGYQALYNNDDPSRSYVVAIGNKAGYTTGHTLGGGQNSVYVGSQAGQDSSGIFNVHLGSGAGANSISDVLIAIGANAGQGVGGNSNIVIGSNAGDVTGNDNIAIGHESLAGGSTRSRQIVIGNRASNNTNLGYTIGIGNDVLKDAQASNTDPSEFHTIAIGDHVLETSTDINNSIYIGDTAGSFNDNGGSGGTNANNVVIGHGSHVNNSQCIKNTVIGVNSFILTSGSTFLQNSIAIGDQSLNNVNVQDNKSTVIAIGSGAANGSDYPTGDAIAIGTYAGESNQGGNTIAIGRNALTYNLANDVAAIGAGAGYGNDIPNSFIISNDFLPSYPDFATAFATISMSSASGATYLFYNSTTFTIQAVRL